MLSAPGGYFAGLFSGVDALLCDVYFMGTEQPTASTERRLLVSGDSPQKLANSAPAILITIDMARAVRAARGEN